MADSRRSNPDRPGAERQPVSRTDAGRNEPLDLTIESLVFGGDGLARHNGEVVFVPFTAPGEQVKARVADSRKSFSKAELLEVVTPSADRVKPRCPYYGECGGCHLQHLAHRAQLQAKREFVVESLQRIGGLENLPVLPTIPSPDQWHYRHQAQFIIEREGGEWAIGFHARKSHAVIDIAECPITHACLNQILTAVRHWAESRPQAVYDAKKRTGWLRGFDARVNHDGSEATVCLIADRFHGQDLRALAQHISRSVKSVVGVAYRMGERRQTKRPSPAQNLLGKMSIQTSVAGITMRQSVDSFSQSNLALTGGLVETALEFAQLQPGMTMIDVYSGTGLFALAAAQRGATVFAIENSPTAAEDARENAKALPPSSSAGAMPSQMTVLSSSAAQGLAMLRQRGVSPAVLLLDPPRGGCEKQTLQEICAIRPTRIVYVSCDPTTLARDLQQLTKAGYQLETVQPLDMFPQTYHVETVALLTRS